MATKIYRTSPARDSYGRTESALSYFSNYSPRQERRRVRKARNDSYSEGTESLSYLAEFDVVKDKAVVKRKTSVLKIRRLDDNTAEYASASLRSPIVSSRFHKTESIISLSASGDKTTVGLEDATLVDNEPNQNRTHEILIKSVLQYVATEKQLTVTPVKKKTKFWQKGGEKFVADKAVLKVNLQKLDASDPVFQVTPGASLSKRQTFV